MPNRVSNASLASRFAYENALVCTQMDADLICFGQLDQACSVCWENPCKHFSARSVPPGRWWSTNSLCHASWKISRGAPEPLLAQAGTRSDSCRVLFPPCFYFLPSPSFPHLVETDPWNGSTPNPISVRTASIHFCCTHVNEASETVDNSRRFHHVFAITC